MVEKKNILLVRTTMFKDAIPPMGLLYIASAIRNYPAYADHNIKIVDCSPEKLTKTSLTEILKKFSPSVVGIGSLDSEFALFKDLCSLVRETCPESAVIAGGPLASNYHSEIVKNRLVDFAVIGEGETTIVELLNALFTTKDFSSVKGICYLRDDGIITTGPREFVEDLDSLAFPAWDLIDIGAYSRIPNWNGMLAEKYYAPLVTSRGCVYHCVYCHNFFGKKTRLRSWQNVLDEMSLLYTEYGVREFHIIDDLFNFDLERVQNICKGILQKGMRVKLSFPNALRVDRLDSATLHWLKKAGTYKITYAIESASPRMQHLIKKNLDLVKAIEVVDETSRLGMICAGFFMFGFPAETIEEMRTTISYAVSSRLDTARFFKTIIHKNTELSKITPNNRSPDALLNPENNLFYGQKSNNSIYSDDIINMVIVEAHWKFYTEPHRLLRLFVKYPNRFKLLKRLLVLFIAIATKKIVDDENAQY